MKVSIVIKALNEEKNIARAIESSLRAIEELNGDGEVVLADSLSTDGTIKIASHYPIKIVQLNNEKDRSCGIGAELGMTVAAGEFIYILDADMTFIDGFLTSAMSKLDADDSLAGVAGLIIEKNLDNVEFQERHKRHSLSIIAGQECYLAGGGLYRRSALESVKYSTHKGLNSYEEFELGARLSVKGWKLVRMDIPSVAHYGHQIDAYKLLLHRVRSGYIFGSGELLRSALGKPHFIFVLKKLRQITLYLGYVVWGICLLILLPLTFFGKVDYLYTIIFVLLPFTFMTIKKRSFSLGFYSVISGVFHAYGLTVGYLMAKVADPEGPIEYKNIKG